MSLREPTAFLSYVRSDDEHDWGRITHFRQRLEGEVKIQTGRPFAIFQDRNDILWGQQWAEIIRSSLAGVTFLIPIITPSFFVSPACRSEFETFLLREKTLGTNRLILPLYYVACDQFEDGWRGDDPIVRELRSRNWTDWRALRFKEPASSEVGSALAEIATAIKNSLRDLEVLIGGVTHKTAPSAVVKASPNKLSIGPVSKKNFTPDIQVLRPARKKFDTDHLAEIHSKHDYYVYTTRFDEEIPAHALSTDVEALQLYKRVSRQVGVIERANKNNPLMHPPGEPASPNQSSCAVTLLVDNSGSLRQSHQSIPLAAWCTKISQWLDSSDIPNEVLGYTTRAWKGGQSRELWLADGKPAQPGRLNDLRHIVYKSFSQDARTAAPSISVMTREGILKENIDGEAILWAANRLEVQDAENRLLFVLSDGAPVDDSTLSVNAGNFLERHLLAVVGWLATRGKISLVAIGIKHDVSKYFSHSYTVREPNEFGLPILETVSKVLGRVSGKS